MADLKNDQKKALARELYMLGNYTYEEIGEKVGTRRQTVSKWAKDGGWDNLKAGMTVTREQILKNLYRHIQQINEGIMQRDVADRVPNTKEADILVKLSAAIKSMEQDVGIADIISSGMRFGEFLRRIDLDKTKEFMNLWDAFIREQIN